MYVPVNPYRITSGINLPKPLYKARLTEIIGALREFGLRYYDEFRRLERSDKVFGDRNTFDIGIVNALEVL